MVLAVTDVESFKEFIRKRARETWDERHTPYYLSYVATDLKKEGVDYRQLIGPLKLGQWASSTPLPGTKVVTHPSQRAKIGFVPQDVEFEFVQQPEVATQPSDGSRHQGRTLVRFVEGLAKLPDEALDQFQVPARTLVALLKN